MSSPDACSRPWSEDKRRYATLPVSQLRALFEGKPPMGVIDEAHAWSQRRPVLTKNIDTSIMPAPLRTPGPAQPRNGQTIDPPCTHGMTRIRVEETLSTNLPPTPIAADHILGPELLCNSPMSISERPFGLPREIRRNDKSDQGPTSNAQDANRIAPRIEQSHPAERVVNSAPVTPNIPQTPATDFCQRSPATVRRLGHLLERPAGSLISPYVTNKPVVFSPAHSPRHRFQISRRRTEPISPTPIRPQVRASSTVADLESPLPLANDLQAKTALSRPFVTSPIAEPSTTFRRPDPSSHQPHPNHKSQTEPQPTLGLPVPPLIRSTTPKLSIDTEIVPIRPPVSSSSNPDPPPASSFSSTTDPPPANTASTASTHASFSPTPSSGSQARSAGTAATSYMGSAVSAGGAGMAGVGLMAKTRIVGGGGGGWSSRSDHGGQGGWPSPGA
ncbi:hypothetical protein BDZ85DRAFT_283883 [Elsinoe ampelina]|uniref:Uncharacterized protein n=1 Tax=Elsinoe ampelina TaxID=302913 RepID=A0A6A6G5T1_9PEZI|nr:hypothetical protein BDZ85DRAFT_283883 [Elsinoe ampelina]